MVLFGGRKDSEEEYEDEESEKKPFRKKPRSKDFKDLKPENRRKRKEPKKPWGKKERFIVLSVMLVTVGISGFLGLSSRSWKLPGLPRLNLNTPQFNWGEETIIIEGQRENKEISQKVVEEFDRLTRNLSGVYGLYVINLESGFSYGFNENEEFEPASLNKLPVMLGMYMEMEEGNLKLEEKYVLKNTDKLAGSGSLQTKPEGTVITYRDLLRYMGKESDNTSFNIARGILGREKIESVIKSVGMENTVFLGDKQKTTPKEIGFFFQRLWWGGLISDVSRDELLAFLTDTIYENHLAAGFPSDVGFAHKYGREMHVVNDAGIVFREGIPGPEVSPISRTYVVVIMSKGIVEREADQIFPDIARFIYEVEINRD